MPKVTCPYCEQTFSFSKLDKFEDVHDVNLCRKMKRVIKPAITGETKVDKDISTYRAAKFDSTKTID